MDVIYECAAKFVQLSMYEYKFIVSKNRQTREIRVNFHNTDFFHLAGLQYLTDITLPRNKKETLNDILFKKKITDGIIGKSQKFINPEPEKDVKSRMEELRFLEEYIDNDNIIQIFTMRNMRNAYSNIRGEYVIKSKLPNSSIVVYLFLSRRKEEPEYYGLISFFVEESISYGGDKLYWMLKEKKTLHGWKTLYRHNSYLISK